LPSIFNAADVAQDSEQPRLEVRAPERVEMAQRPQVAFLHRVGIRGVVQQVAGKRIDSVELRQRGAKTLRPRRILGCCLGWADGKAIDSKGIPWPASMVRRTKLAGL
jgi:hypothetical protein